MAEEEDFNSLPLTERWVHKNWKARKSAYEFAAAAFDAAQTEHDGIVGDFSNESNLWKSAVTDSNVAAQQEGLAALCSFLQIASHQGCIRCRGVTITPIVEKGLAATRPAAKQKALEALLLFIELDKSDPVVEELVSILSHKQPKIIAATLSALTQIYHAYGCKTVGPKPVLKILPKVFAHADKNVRAEAQNLTVELYRWLKEAMKPLFWSDLKLVQQQDLEKLFEKVRDEPSPKQERLLRSQQAAQAAAASSLVDAVEPEEEAVDEDQIDLEPEYQAVNVFHKVPKDLQERVGSSKWKDRKDALDELHQALNHPRIEQGPFDDIVRSCAKCMKDANIAVVTMSANCIELLAKGLRQGFAKYRSTIMNPMMERLKEKKQSVTDAIALALDAVFLTVTLTDCLEEILECLKHKNPQVKLESTRFLVRCLTTTREPPQAQEIKSIADAATKLLTESQAVQRDAGAEVLGTLWKIIGDRAMAPHMNNLDDIRKTKIKEFHETAQVRAKVKPPKPPAAPPKLASATGKRPGTATRKPAGTVKKPTPAVSLPEEIVPATPKPVARLVPSKIGAPKFALQGSAAMRPPSTGLNKKLPAIGSASPARKLASPTEDPPYQESSKPSGLGRGLAARPLARPAALPALQAPQDAPLTASGLSGLSSAERAELEELRLENDRLTQENEVMRIDRQKITSRLAALDDQNRELIEKHTQDHLSIKAKDAQLVRARSDVESYAEETKAQQREIDRLKRELSRQARASSPGFPEFIPEQSHPNTVTAAYSPTQSNPYRNNLSYLTSMTAQSIGTGLGLTAGLEGSHYAKASPRNARLNMHSPETEQLPFRPPAFTNTSMPTINSSGDGAESWKRAAEVTQNLKARIEMMKVPNTTMSQNLISTDNDQSKSKA